MRYINLYLYTYLAKYSVCKFLLVFHCNCGCIVPFLRYSIMNNGLR